MTAKKYSRKKSNKCRQRGGKRRAERRQRIGRIGVLVLAALAVFLVFALVPDNKAADAAAYYGTQEGGTTVFFNDAQVPIPVKRENGHVYLGLDYVRSALNSRFYYDEETGGVLYVLPDRTLTLMPGTAYPELGGPENMPLYLSEEGTQGFLELDLICSLTRLHYAVFESPDRLWLWNVYDAGISTAVTEKKTMVRIGNGIKYRVLEELEAGSSVVVTEVGTFWAKVLTESGHLGYVKTRELSEITEKTVTWEEAERRAVQSGTRYNGYTAWSPAQNYSGTSFEGKISLGFDYIDDISYGLEVLKQHLSDGEAVNVLAPTWFNLQGGSGAFSSCADSAYVALAHENGMQVWAVLDNFNGECDTLSVLRSRTARAALIGGLLDAVAEKGIDGINLDFEGMDAETNVHYLEFVRELKQVCAVRGIIVSADTYAPYSWNAKYDLPELGAVLDYVVIMGYDESWETPGPNSSPKFVTFCCEGSLKSVDAEKLIVAVPFYTRGWATIEGGYDRIEISMKKCAELIASGMETEWLEEAGCYHGTAEFDGTVREIWLEELRSAETRLSIISSYDIAGAAYWRLGKEDPGVWALVRQYVLK